MFDRRLLIKSIYMFIAVLLLMISLGNIQIYAENKVNEIDIMTTPEKLLFNINNLKPGDWAKRTVIITNSGKEDYKYITSAKLKNGSEKLYNELLLIITDSDGEIFNNKLGEFKKLDPRILISGQEEELIFTIKFPSELGNDFQGLSSEVEFKYYVEGTLGGTLPVDGPKLPETGTNAYNILLTGTILLVVGGVLLLINRLRKMRRIG
ncbi:LPXTG cell wall anchor domain-containing protein [Lederbergia graminis]|uniref:LPXTG cell wall anchor domain-containing protein n=1 Tax=Lederbergia graminis TaxID=735518 RepID=A0ABW0LIH8_9BACI